MNGWVFSLFGLYDASLVDARFAGPFKHSAETLACHLDDYDAGFCLITTWKSVSPLPPTIIYI